MADNFKALWPTDSKFSALKDIRKPFKKFTKNQEPSSILKVVFALSKWLHLHRAYVVTVCSVLRTAVFTPVRNSNLKGTLSKVPVCRIKPMPT